MEKITSFTIDHIKLEPGLYVSRKDKVGAETVTTFDLRVTNPNEEPVMNTAEIHTMEHLAATYLRNEPTWKDKVLYFGPMGCRTGFYLLLAGDYESADIVELVKSCFEFIWDFRDEVPDPVLCSAGGHHVLLELYCRARQAFAHPFDFAQQGFPAKHQRFIAF